MANVVDLRKHRPIVVDELKNVRKTDKWGWRLKAVTKNEIRIRWGYFDYLEEDKEFLIRAEDESIIIHTMDAPPTVSDVILVGAASYNDVSDWGAAVRIAIRKLARKAHSVW